MKFGEITFGGRFSGFNMVEKPTSEIPNEVVSAVNTTCNVNGYTYTPIWYFGEKQTKNGKNHLIVCKREKDNEKQLVLIVINLPPNSNGKNATVVSCVDSADLYGDLKEMFENSLNDVTGVKYTPLAFIGEKAVKGINYYILSIAKVDNFEQYAVIIEVNKFMEKTTLIGIIRLGGLGYAFNW